MKVEENNIPLKWYDWRGKIAFRVFEVIYIIAALIAFASCVACLFIMATYLLIDVLGATAMITPFGSAYDKLLLIHNPKSECLIQLWFSAVVFVVSCLTYVFVVLTYGRIINQPLLSSFFQEIFLNRPSKIQWPC